MAARASARRSPNLPARHFSIWSGLPGLPLFTARYPSGVRTEDLAGISPKQIPKWAKQVALYAPGTNHSAAGARGVYRRRSSPPSRRWKSGALRPERLTELLALMQHPAAALGHLALRRLFPSEPSRYRGLADHHPIPAGEQQIERTRLADWLRAHPVSWEFTALAWVHVPSGGIVDPGPGAVHVLPGPDLETSRCL